MTARTATKPTTATDSIDHQIGELADFGQDLYADLPELDQAEARRTTIEVGMTRLRDALGGRDLASTVAKVIDDLGGDGDPVAAVDTLVGVAGLTAAADTMTSAAVIHLNAAEANVTHARTAAADTLLARLNDTLGQVIAATRTVLADLPNGVESADQAIGSGPDAVTAWGRLQRLRDVHRGIRTAQLRVMSDLQPGIRALEPIHFCDNAWQVDVPGYGDDDGLALLRFLTRSDVTAWVPTRPQQADADKRARADARATAHAEQATVQSLQGKPVTDRQMQQHRDLIDYAQRTDHYKSHPRAAELA